MLSTLAAVIASNPSSPVSSADASGISAWLSAAHGVRHTSETAIGQITFRGELAADGRLVALYRLRFVGRAGRLPTAAAVTGAMLVDATLATAVGDLVWRWQWPIRPGVRSSRGPDLAFFIPTA